ncbi:hypothetical protein [Soonwooa purpurea]
MIEQDSDKKIIKFIIYFFVTSFLLLIVYLAAISNLSTKNAILSINRTTKVVDIYHNIHEHNFLFVKYSDGYNGLLEYPYIIGDSISKKKGDSIEYIFRGDSILKNNLLERARKDGLLK